jgi:hypothetical protein
MKAGMASDPGQSSRSKPGITGGVAASFLGWFAEIGQAAKYFLRLKHPASAENCAESAVAEAGAGHAATDNTDAKPTATKSCAIAVTADVNVGPLGINGVGQTVPDEQEIERRRNLVRTLFNDFWSGVYEKPTAFVERLDQAEDYLNERLAASGEIWRLNTNTRLTLGLPPRSNSSGPQAAKCVDNRQPDRGRGAKPFVKS